MNSLNGQHHTEKLLRDCFLLLMHDRLTLLTLCLASCPRRRASLAWTAVSWLWATLGVQLWKTTLISSCRLGWKAVAWTSYSREPATSTRTRSSCASTKRQPRMTRTTWKDPAQASRMTPTWTTRTSVPPCPYLWPSSKSASSASISTPRYVSLSFSSRLLSLMSFMVSSVRLVEQSDVGRCEYPATGFPRWIFPAAIRDFSQGTSAYYREHPALHWSLSVFRWVLRSLQVSSAVWVFHAVLMGCFFGRSRLAAHR